MRRKRLISAALSIVMLVSTAGCGSRSMQQTTAVQPEGVTEAVSESGKQEADGKAETEAMETLPSHGERGAAAEDAAKLRGEQKFRETPEKTAAYLKHYFDIVLPEHPDTAAFSEALKKISGKDVIAEGELNWDSAVSMAVSAAGYEELALTYDDEKAEERLRQYGVEAEGNVLSRIACAADVDLITPEQAVLAVQRSSMDAPSAGGLLMRVADALGAGRNYLGLASDPDIFGKLEKSWNSFQLFEDPVLSEIGRKAVEQKITTGYGLKCASYDAKFLPELTLQYGHSDILHAHQLIGLLDSENINARIQLEPKVSIYQYLPEWGPAPEATPTYEVKKFSDALYLVYAVEYDLKLEFAEKEEMLAFDRVIKEFAKKNSDNADMKGLIYGSWWQPLYSTTREDMPAEDYHLIYDCVMKNGQYSIHPFTTEEKKDAVLRQLSALSDGISAEAEKRYVNTAFYNYLSGQDYQ